jgi:hypothetical protein
MVYPGQNEVPVHANASLIGVKRSGRNQIHFRATVSEKHIP